MFNIHISFFIQCLRMMHCCIEKTLAAYWLFFFFGVSKPLCPIIIIYFSACRLYFARRQAFSPVFQSTFRAPRQLLKALQVLVFEAQFPNESISILSISMFFFSYPLKLFCFPYVLPSHPSTFQSPYSNPSKTFSVPPPKVSDQEPKIRQYSAAQVH